MDSRRSPEVGDGKPNFYNYSNAQNISGGSGQTVTMHVTSSATPSVPPTVPPSISVGASDEQTVGFRILQEDGPCLSKPPSNVVVAGDLILKSEKSFGTPPKAHALIINIYHYDQKCFTEDKMRLGSDKDVENLTRMFNSFHVGVFTPVTHDPSADTVIYVESSDVGRWIADFKNKVGEAGTKMEQQACFVCIMGHGTRNGFITDSRGNGISLETEIFRPFNNEFLAMQKKPKIFLTNCCRGNDPSLRVPWSKDDGSAESQATLPNLTDFLILWSTTPENSSYLNKLTGSIFIRTICYILQKHQDQLALEYYKPDKEKTAHWVDIKTILKAVGKEMEKFIYTDEKGKDHSQTPDINDRSFGRFRWRVDDFDYSPNEDLPSYLMSS